MPKKKYTAEFKTKVVLSIVQRDVATVTYTDQGIGFISW